MKIDEHGLIITSLEAPGCYGDSCAETARFGILCYITNRPFNAHVLSNFITDLGILRHPNSPWREDDTSDDQKEPLFFAVSSTLSDGCFLVDKYLKVAKPYKFNATKALGQALIFKYMPIRWNDGFKKFEPMENSSCDYLNFAMKIMYLHINNAQSWQSRLAMRLVPKEKVIERIENYYNNDPENNRWIVEYWKQAIELVWK